MNARPLLDISEHVDVARALSPVARAIGLARTARGAVRGFTVGAGLGALLLLAGHVLSIDLGVPVALMLVIAGTVAGAMVGAAHWPRTADAARTADRFFQLDDRLTTALELRGTGTPVARVQNRDVARRIDGLPLAQSRGAWIDRRELGLALVAALALTAGLLVGPQRVTPHATGAPSSTLPVRRAAVRRVSALSAQLHRGLTPAQLHSPAVRRLDQALAQLRRRLLLASTPRASLRAVSLTQAQLRRLSQGLHPINSRAVAQLSNSMSSHLSPSQTRGASRSTRTSAQALSRALNQLARSLSHLSAAQKSALARALAQAANANSNAALRSALGQAASALANGDARSSAAALRQSAQSLAQSASAQAALTRAAAASAQLNALKNQIAGTGAAPPSFSPRGGQSPSSALSASQGTGHSSGRSQAGLPGQGKGKGRGGLAGNGGSGRRGSGRGTGRGRSRGNGRSTAIGTGRGTAGAHGSGGRGRAGTTHRGAGVTVYIPGKAGKGAEIVRNGPQGAPVPGEIVPYQQVVGQYSQQARQALDRAALPPTLQTYVRRYFTTLSR